jgi:hypothetical protein
MPCIHRLHYQVLQQPAQTSIRRAIFQILSYVIAMEKLRHHAYGIVPLLRVTDGLYKGPNARALPGISNGGPSSDIEHRARW